MTEATETYTVEQHGGQHYKGLAIQPQQYNEANRLSWTEGEIVKLITRNKEGATDLAKVIHYAKMLLEQRYGLTYLAGQVLDMATGTAVEGDALSTRDRKFPGDARG